MFFSNAGVFYYRKHNVNCFNLVVVCGNFADFFIVFGVIFAVIDFLFLNEWAIIPLTKRAKAAHELEKQRELAEKQKNESPDDLSEDGKGEN